MAKIAKRRNRWVIDFYDNQSKRRWITMPKGSKKKDAKDKLVEIEDQLAKGVYIPEKKIPTFKKVADDWLEYKKPNIRFNTWKNYRGYIKNHFGYFANSKINRISTAKVEKFVAKKQTEQTNIRTLKKVLSALNLIFKYAVRHKYIDSNPVSIIERPKDQRKTSEKEVFQVLTEEQIPLLLENTKEYEFKVLFQLALFSGARQGELFGLKWADIDLDNSQIEIKRSFNDRKWYPPKSLRSRRRINIGPVMLAELKKWRLKSFYSQDRDLVFPNSFGRPLGTSDTLRKHFFPALKAARLPKIRFHDMRHTFASHLLDQGEDVIYVSQQLGHSSPVITLQIYSHLIRPDHPQAALKLEEKIYQKSGSKVVADTEKNLKKHRRNKS